LIIIHLEPLVIQVRCFDDGKEWGDVYKTVLTVQKLGEVGFCSGCHGEFSMSDFRELERQLKEFGITELKWNRSTI
jgi:hypothetical protein